MVLVELLFSIVATPAFAVTAAVALAAWFVLFRRPTTAAGNTPAHASRDSTLASKSPGNVETLRASVDGDGLATQDRIKIYFGTQTGNSKYFANELCQRLTSAGMASTVFDLDGYDPEVGLTTEAEQGSVAVFIISTYTDGTPPKGAEWFCTWLGDVVDDFRVSKTMLEGLRFAVFGLGNSLYANNFNAISIRVDRQLAQLSASRLYKRGFGDENVAQSAHGGLEADFDVWAQGLVAQLTGKTTAENTSPPSSSASAAASPSQATSSSCGGSCTCGAGSGGGDSGAGACGGGDDAGGCADCGGCAEPDDEDEELYETTSEEEEDDDEEELADEDAGLSLNTDGGVIDLEDMGKVVKKMKKAKKDRAAEEAADQQVALKSIGGRKAAERREMVTPMLRKALTKQGYQIVGSHSGVKLCRWTKSMMRGRGGCYKHTMYGIQSHQCMEATPSLACANKCVFCWRHHTNPVGTEWRWKMDGPEMIVEEGMLSHYKMIKQFRGVPGVKPERFSEAHNIQHCALSLVGEPIMYPEINELCRLLHKKMISTFLVTNAQFPDAIRNLVPVTQLYVSIDASTKESLKKIDRPLFRDFWPRFLDSLQALSDKGQRTVYRLTLVSGWNTEEMQAYASLVARGNPDFIEVKGVTYCGDSKASTLTMKNVPWHEEVVGFVQQLADLLPDYEIACEHEHSNCLLVAHKKFKIDNRWHTWIDYPKFHQLMSEYEASGGKSTFTALDYVAPTPAWAVFGCVQQGFDPQETRYHRKRGKKDIGGC